MTDLPPAADPVATPSPLASRLASRLQRLPFSWWWLPGLAAAVLLLYYPVGMLLMHKIDDDPDFAPAQVAAGQSRVVAAAAALVHREVDVNGWTPNDPLFMPSWALDDMPAFQQGVVGAAARFAAALADEAGMARGPSGVDVELQRAAGLLKYPGTVWKFDPKAAWAPTASAEKQYRNAMRSLELFNTRIAAGQATFERRAPALAGVLAAVARDLDAAAAVLDARVADHPWALFDFQADELFFVAKGRVYAYGLLLRELGWDMAPLLNQRDQAAAWGRMVDTLRTAGQLSPAVVLNGAPDATLLPSHLASQGFLILRARAQAAELAEALRR